MFDKENTVANDEKLGRIWQRKMQEREVEFAKIKKKRLKALRMVADKRSKIENKISRRDIIQDYGGNLCTESNEWNI